jgi:hypothetical protein
MKTQGHSQIGLTMNPLYAGLRIMVTMWRGLHI